MRNRALVLLTLSSVASLGLVGSLLGACGGSSEGPSQFDAGTKTPTGTGGDATTNPGQGDDDGDDGGGGKFVIGDSGGGGNTGDAAIDCDANKLACMKAVCGDSLVEPGETCDDGNAVSGDGCSSSCQTEANYYACIPGELCKDVRDCNQLAEAGVPTAADSGCVAPPKAAVCGDGVLDTGEACDTGSDVGTATSGCSQDCKSVFDGYACTNPGHDCTNTWICGDGKVEGAEQCDDGNMISGDGCSSPACTIDPGYKCTLAGIACTAKSCGDGIVAKPETCDTGSTSSAGCVACKLTSVTTTTAGSATTQPSTNITNYNCTYVTSATTTASAFTMPAVGSTANVTLAAGSKVGSVGNNATIAGEGTLTITAVSGLTVTLKNPSPAVAGNKPVNTMVATGAAFTNVPTQETCAATVCGNGPAVAGNPVGTPEGTEQCDDGNNLNYDGCSATCQLEPSCPTGACVAVCGDGLVFNFDGNGDGQPDEACDDGNTVNGDGCSSTCTVEMGYTCNVTTLAAPAYIDVPVVYRDMLYNGTSYKGPKDTASKVYGHPDFEYFKGANATPDMTKTVLTAGVPVFEWDGLHDLPPATTSSAIDPVTGQPNPNSASQGQQQLTSAKDFTDWYADILDPDAAGLTVTRGVRVDAQQIRMVLRSGSYVFDSNCDQPYGAGYDTNGNCITVTNQVYDSGSKSVIMQTQYGGLGGFYPLDGKGWNSILTTPQTDVDQWTKFSSGTTNVARDAAHNFSFTTHFRYYFTYNATANPSPILDFSGDDDVWVFLNDKRALDIGGLHSRLEQSFTLNSGLGTALGLVDGHVYEVDLFNAERHTTASNFKLTLTNFQKKTSVCMPTCGDGVRTAGEQCDNGKNNVDPAGGVPYDACTTSCTLGPYCGDHNIDMPQEQCDDAVNQTPYATASTPVTACAPGCKKPAYCGDSTVQPTYGEVCDNGSKNSDTNNYNGCTTTCQAGPRCGDAVVQASFGEVCDNGFNATPYVRHPMTGDCAPGCVPPTYCGDGKVDVPYEICDNGSANSDTGAYNSCTSSCALGPHCGDGTVQSPEEQCDDGNQVNNDGCSAACQKETGIR